MTKRPVLNLFCILLSLVVSYDIVMPLIVYFSSPRIISYFTHERFSSFDMLSTFGIYIVIPKLLALFVLLPPATLWNRSPAVLRTIKLSYLIFVSNVLTAILFGITLWILSAVLMNGYTLHIALNYRSGYIVKFMYVLTSLSIDILILSKRAKVGVFRFGDFIFFANQIILLDKLLLGVIIFCKIAVILVYSKSNVQRDSRNWKEYLSILMFLSVLAGIYFGNRILRGDDKTIFFDVLYGYLVAPVIYLYSYINHSLNTTYLMDMVFYVIRDNSISRAFLFSQGFVPNYYFYLNTFQLSKELGLNVSYNIFRFDGGILELSRLTGVHFGVMIFSFYFMMYALIFRFSFSKSLVNRLIAILALVFLFFGFSDTSYDFYFTAFCAIFCLKVLSPLLTMTRKRPAQKSIGELKLAGKMPQSY